MRFSFLEQGPNYNIRRTNWRKVLYDSYVSRGQDAERSDSAREQFRPREFYLRKIIRELFPANRDARILDIGCGHGALLYFLAQCGYCNSAGVDASMEQTALAKRMGIQNIESGDGMEFLNKQSSGSADVVCVFDVLEHLTRQELFELLSEVRRVLTSGGRCVGHVPNAAGLFGMRIRYGDLTHELAFTSTSLRQVFRALGFAGIRCYEDKPVVHGFKSTIRRILWDIGTAPLRILLAAETGETEFIMSQNLLFAADMSKESFATNRS